MGTTDRVRRSQTIRRVGRSCMEAAIKSPNAGSARASPSRQEEKENIIPARKVDGELEKEKKRSLEEGAQEG